MGKWVIPYVDQEPAFWEEIAEQYGDCVSEVYFPPPAAIIGSGRSRQPARYLESFLAHAPLPKAVLLNPVVLPQPADQLAGAVLDCLDRLRGEYGVESVTVTDLTLARRIREAYPGHHITASVLMRVAQPSQVMMVERWVDAITADNSLVRDLPGLRRLRAAYRGELRMIVNEACIPGCVYRIQHFHEMGYGEHFPESLCETMLEDMPWLRLTGAWILPRHLGYFDGLVDTLKLAGRVTLQDPARYRAVLGAYVRREDILPRDIGGGPASVLAPISVSDAFFEHVLCCDKSCKDCTYCREYYAHALSELEECRLRT